MLGYVNIDKGELKVREYEIYCGYYCGICKSIGRRYGQLPRMALSYDAAFLAIMLASLDETPDVPAQEHCVAHPIIKKKTVIRNNAIEYAGDIMLILAWYKLLDDAKDEGKLYAKATMRILKRIYKKLRSKYPFFCEDVESRLAHLSALEKEKCDSLDMAAEAFSKIMEVIFAQGVSTVYGEAPARETPAREAFAPEEQTTLSDSLARIGYHMGKWIYLMDAIDDIEENIHTGAYNPLLYRFHYDKNTETPDAFRQRIEPDLKFNLYHYLAIIGNCVNSLDIKKNQGIIENIIYFGLNRRTEEIVNRTNPEQKS